MVKNSLSENYEEFVEKPLTILQDIGVNMSIKVHFFFFLHSNLDKFPDNCGDVSYEQGKQFH